MKKSASEKEEKVKKGKKPSWQLKRLDKTKRLKFHLKNRVLPKISNFLQKLLYTAFWGLIILFIIRLFKWDLSWINFFSSLAIYYSLQEITVYLYKLRWRRTE